jgi:hypothetical protein
MKTSLKITVLIFFSLLVGCDHESTNWDAHVLAKAENPKNGYFDFTDQRAEVVSDRCGFLLSQCVSVRLLDETGFANAQGGRLFTYRGDSQAISINWQDAKTLRIRCKSCDPKKIERQLTQVNFVSIKYEL